MSIDGLYDGLNRGELDCLFELFLRHRDAFREYYHRLAARRPEWQGQTDDMLHEALLSLARVLGQEDGQEGAEQPRLGIGRDRFEAYFCRIVRNMMFDLARAVQRHRTFRFQTTDGGAQRSPVAADPSPSGCLQEHETVEMVQRELLALPPQDREVLMLWMLGVPFEESARRLGVSKGAAYSHKKRAMQRLRERLPHRLEVFGS